MGVGTQALCTALGLLAGLTWNSGDQRRTALDHIVPRLLVEHRVPSISIAHIEGGRVVLVAAWGEQRPGVPATPRTLYNVASMAKPVSAEVVLRLASRDEIALDEPMHVHWVDPDLAGDERRRSLTPRLALSHRTGLPNWRDETGGVLRFQFDPGSRIGYSGEGYEYVARFAERKLGREFEALAQTLVFDPLGLADTTYTRRAGFEERIAVPTDGEGKTLAPQIRERYLASDDLHTTAADYARFMLAVLKREGVSAALAGEREWVQASRRETLCSQARLTRCPEAYGFGLGWEVFRLDEDVYLMHTGRDAGVFAFGYVSPTTGNGTVIFTNGEHGARIVLPVLDRLGADRPFVELLRGLAGGS